MKEFPVVVELGTPTEIEEQHYTAAAHKTANALADEINNRLATYCSWDNGQREFIAAVARATLTDWFTGKWKPGRPLTDPPDGAPDLELQK